MKFGEAEINGVFEYDIATIREYNDGSFENEEEVMQRLRVKIEEMLGNSEPFQVNNIPSLWIHAWNTIDNYIKRQDSEIVVSMERARVEERNVTSEKSDNRWNYLKEDLTRRFYDLIRDISLNQDKDTSINDLDTYFK